MQSKKICGVILEQEHEHTEICILQPNHEGKHKNRSGIEWDVG